LPGLGLRASTAASATRARKSAEEDAIELFIFVTWLVLSIAAAVYASNKGRSGAGIFFLSLFLSPLVGFLVAVAMEPNHQQASAAKGMKKCPDCAEFVQPDAKICRFCRHEFPATTADDQEIIRDSRQSFAERLGQWRWPDQSLADRIGQWLRDRHAK
jgi:RNA polymerase subunit RPABC4/transcription elongation factor Spt4